MLSVGRKSLEIREGWWEMLLQAPPSQCCAPMWPPPTINHQRTLAAPNIHIPIYSNRTDSNSLQHNTLQPGHVCHQPILLTLPWHPSIPPLILPCRNTCVVISRITSHHPLRLLPASRALVLMRLASGSSTSKTQRLHQSDPKTFNLPYVENTVSLQSNGVMNWGFEICRFSPILIQMLWTFKPPFLPLS